MAIEVKEIYLWESGNWQTIFKNTGDNPSEHSHEEAITKSSQIKNTLKAFNDLKTSKKVCEVMFFDM